jgi:5-methylcytosine-specific restriction endonuclease McrA
MPHKDPEARKAYMKEYVKRYYAKNSKLVNQKTMAWRKKNPENWAKKLETAKKYREAHPDRVKASLAKVDKFSHRVEYRKQWKVLHPEIIKVVNTKARLKRKLTKELKGGTCTLKQWQARYEYFGGCCAYCGRKLYKSITEIDHVIPMSKGGTGWPSNLVPACRSCNAKKWAYLGWKPLPIYIRRKKEMPQQKSSGATSESG